MAKELIEKYNHLRYTDASSDQKGFVDFLYENSDLSAPEVDVEAAWDSLTSKLNTTDSKSYSTPWIRIAASVVVLIGVSLFVWHVASSPKQVTIASSSDLVNVTFPDGSIGILNTNSSFSYPEKFKNERLVSFEGEAYFDIQKSKKPFIIDVNGVEVKVLGTAFNLVTSENEVELYVERGLVAFEKNGNQTEVKAGLKAVFNKIDDSVAITENPSMNITSWTDGTLTFDDTPFLQATKDLEDFYHVDFEVMNKRINACKLTVTFENEKLDEVLKTIESILGVKMAINDKVIKVSGKGC